MELALPIGALPTHWRRVFGETLPNFVPSEEVGDIARGAGLTEGGLDDGQAQNQWIGGYQLRGARFKASGSGSLARKVSENEA